MTTELTHGELDAVVWAKAFVERFPDMDEATMIGWFANAIMSGVDATTWKYDAQIREYQAMIAHSAQFHAGLCNGNHDMPLGGGGKSICNCIGFWHRAEAQVREIFDMVADGQHSINDTPMLVRALVDNQKNT